MKSIISFISHIKKFTNDELPVITHVTKQKWNNGLTCLQWTRNVSFAFNIFETCSLKSLFYTLNQLLPFGMHHPRLPQEVACLLWRVLAFLGSRPHQFLQENKTQFINFFLWCYNSLNIKIKITETMSLKFNVLTETKLDHSVDSAGVCSWLLQTEAWGKKWCFKQ